MTRPIDPLPQTYRFGAFRLDAANRRLTHAGRLVNCTGQRLHLLELLISRAGHLVCRETIRDALWPDRHVAFDAAINVCIRDLRRLLAIHDGDDLIRTIPKHGYMFTGDVEVSAPMPRGESRPRHMRRATIAAASLALTAALAIPLMLHWTAPDLPYEPAGSALAAYVQGENLYQQHLPQSNADAASYFRTAIAQDDGYALAWAGLADVMYYGSSEFAPDIEASRSAAETALALDPDLARATLRLADIAFTHDWNMDSAARLYDRAQRLDPGNVSIRHSRSAFLLAAGDESGAIGELRAALAIDPLSAVMTSDLAWTLSLAGDHDAALSACETLAGLAPDHPRSAACRLRPLLALGRVDEAADLAAGLMSASGETQAPLAPADTLEAFWTWRTQVSTDPVARAVAHARLGQVEQTLSALETARAARNRRLAFVHLFHEFSLLAAHPRFQQIAPFADLPDPQI